MADRPTDRPVKSYLERYHDIKDMLNKSDRQGSSSEAADRSQKAPIYVSKSTSGSRREADPIAIHQIDDESSKTLERWESRRERKLAENPSYASRIEASNCQTTRRVNRRAPKIDYGYKYDSPELNVRKEPISSLGDCSPLFNDVELSPNEGATNVNPLSIHNHFKQHQSQQSKSRYSEGLQSLRNTTSYWAAREMAKDYWTGEDAQLSGTKQTPQHEMQDEYKPDPIEYYEDAQEPEGEEKFIRRRIRMGAADCCKRLSCKSGSNDDAEEIYKDPDAFAPAWSSSKKTWHIYAAVLVCIGCVIATAFTVKYVSGERSATFAVGMTFRPTTSSMPSAPPSESPSSIPSATPTNRPTSERDRLISEYLADITEGVSNVEGSPQFEAKMWLLYNDKLNLSLPTYGSEKLVQVVKERIMQRYALATFYFAMGIGEGAVLKGWLEGDECKFVGDYDKAWDGVDCDEEGEVRALAIGKFSSAPKLVQPRDIFNKLYSIPLSFIDGANLSGSIPHQISLLHRVQNLIIKNNPNLSGNIPTSIGDMIGLKQIALYNNSLTGTLPKSILQLPELLYLNVADNTLMGEINWGGLSFQRNLARVILQDNFFEGTIPFKTLAGTKLTLLGLSNNNFRGYVDSSIASMTELEYLYLDRNKFAGQLPNSLGDLSNLVALNLDENEFQGPLPSTIGQLSKLKYLSAKGNSLSGGLPTQTRKLNNLQTLNLAHNALTGNIRSLIAMPSLEHVHLYQNSFTGEIPTSLFAAQNLKTLFLSSNSLTGGIPAEISSARKLKGLYLSDNMLQGSIPNTACSLKNLGKFCAQIVLTDS